MDQIGTISDDEVRAALSGVLASPAFQSAPQLASFLTFVVEKRLAGEQASIKGYTIATQALGRADDFDPQADPIVRVEAGRLRRVLAAYYEGPGRDEPIRFSIPRGSYVPRFERVPHAAPAAAGPAPGAVAGAAPTGRAQGPEPGEPSRTPGLRRPLAAAASLLGIALAAFLVLGAGRYFAGAEPERAGLAAPPVLEAPADGRPLVAVAALDPQSPATQRFSLPALRAMVLEGLARFDEIAVIDLARGGQSAPGSDRYVLDLLAVPGGDPAPVTVRLSQEASGKVVWARSFDPAQRADLTVSPEAGIARQIATSVGQPYGVLFADLRGRSDLSLRARCLIQAYDHWRSPARDTRKRVRDCLEALAAAQPTAATALANLAALCLEQYRGGEAGPEVLDRALKVARQAVDLAPESPRTNQVMMEVLFAHEDIEAALASGRRAAELNPYDTDILAGYGSKLVLSGHYREGADLIARAAEANPADPPWYDFFLFVAAFMRDDWPAAKAAAARIQAPDDVLGLVAKIAVAASEGQDAKPLVARLVAAQPDFAVDPQRALARRNLGPAVQARLLDALRRAGLDA